MDAETLAALEYPAIVERLVEASSTEAGAALAHELLPSSEPQEVARRQTLTTEAVALLDESAEPALTGVRDVRSFAERATRGGVLTTEELHAIRVTVEIAIEARRVLSTAEAPLLNELAAHVEPTLGALADLIERTLEPDGADVRDTATPKLRRLRSELRAGRERASAELARIARSSELAEHLQERFVTVRGGRPVLALKVGARGKVPGIVHDASASGQTLFVEPLAVVELNNRLAEAAGEEREEVERILAELSAVAGTRAGELDALVAATADRRSRACWRPR